MLSIEATMLVALGFLLAILLVLAIIPIYRRRVERLTTKALRGAMPLTETEIRADKDRLRAESAIRIHDLEERVEKAKQKVARQRVEINRRDGVISGLEGAAKRQGTALEEHENARRVLEQTIMDRLPKVEQRLAEAKRLLLQRDREISRLTEAADRQSRALEETTQINTQNRDEIHRLQAALTTRAARNRDGIGDPRFDGEVALRSEIEALRAKTRDQEQMVAKLQALVSRAGGVKAVGLMDRIDAGANENQSGIDDELGRLRAQLAEAEANLRSIQRAANDGSGDRDRTDAEIRRLKTANEDQKLEIARLSSALKAYQDSERKDTALAEGKMAMKSRIAALQSQTEGQATTIQSLRAEVAASNERLARQAAHYMDELKKLGGGTRSPLDSRRGSGMGRAYMGAASAPVVGNGVASSPASNGASVSGHAPAVDRYGVQASGTAQSDAPSLTDRITEPRKRRSAPVAASASEPKPAANDLEPAEAAPVEAGSVVKGAAEETSEAAQPRPGGLLERITRIDNKG